MKGNVLGVSFVGGGALECEQYFGVCMPLLFAANEERVDDVVFDAPVEGVGTAVAIDVHGGARVEVPFDLGVIALKALGGRGGGSVLRRGGCDQKKYSNDKRAPHARIVTRA